jgi:hypothetical protein
VFYATCAVVKDCVAIGEVTTCELDNIRCIYSVVENMNLSMRKNSST